MHDIGIQNVKSVFNNTKNAVATVIPILHYALSILFSLCTPVIATTNE
jgi:hypothetical protein